MAYALTNFPDTLPKPRDVFKEKMKSAKTPTEKAVVWIDEVSKKNKNSQDSWPPNRLGTTLSIPK